MFMYIIRQNLMITLTTDYYMCLHMDVEVIDRLMFM